MERTHYLDFVENKFIECFSNKGYIQEKSVKITSQIDPTVDFVGSHISVLKNNILTNNIGHPGRFLIQECIKTKALKHIRTTTPVMFGSYYKCMGILAEPNLTKVCEDVFEYFLSDNYLNISPNELRIRINSKDDDLLEATKGIDRRIIKEIDTMDEKHYKHKYGLDSYNITGRDFNIALKKNGTNEFINCGTFVAMETPEKTIGIDIGIGNCTLSMCKFGYNSTIESSRMADIMNITSVEQEKMADALIIVATLLKEDAHSHTSKHYKAKFNRYYNTFRYWNEKYNISNEEILNYILEYLKNEYNHDFTENKEKWSRILKR